MLGLSAAIRACLFDLDGVLTRTATVHAAAWRQTFDDFLRARDGAGFVPFTASDYERYVDGKPRDDGTRDFLTSRGIWPDEATVAAIGTRKNEQVQREIAAGNVEVFGGSVRFLRAARDAGLRTAVVSSSANCQLVLASVGIEDLFDVRVDGQVAVTEHIAGKPAPDMFLAAATRLQVPAAASAVFEDAIAGVAAGRAGGFGYVVGVNRATGDRRTAHERALLEHGADRVVSDLEELL
ncbi:MAG TPA: beta-phosphoglucomutase family hydrolase [Mycobacteriales bacterium]|jgi:beta-phosphoglucomutase family hydrolase|nr:beta-phosphoglucomutase family hydrolase [Mycobacteriales bacterium]